MKVGYPDHKRPLYLAASINQILIKRALVDIGASVNLIPLNTLQQSSKFKNLFDQLGLTTKERKIATKALVSITSGAGVECLSAEIPEDRALL